MPDTTTMTGTIIDELPESSQSQLNDSTKLIVEDTAPTTRRVKISTFSNWIKTKLGIGTASSLQTTSKEIVGAINELNSSLSTVERQEMSGSTYLPPANAYKNCKFVQWRCAGTAQKALNTGTEYQVGTLQEKFRPIASLYKYEKYAQGKECQVVIGTDGAITVQFFENLPAGTAMNINVYFMAK